MKKRAVGLGAGGHAKVVIEILRHWRTITIVGLLDRDARLKGKKVLGIPVLGDDRILDRLIRQGVEHFFVSLGSVSDSSPRRRLYEMALSKAMSPIGAVHPKACVSPSATLGRGTFVMPGAVINASVSIGENVIINTGAVVEHDCVIGDHVHVATGAKIAGGVTIGSGAHVGIGATLKQGIHIGKDAVIGAGAVALDSVPPGVTVAGVPAKPLRRT